jgi:peptidoglycan/xylan/chitin deacetylase (PgdA/CDA1 family)
MGAVCRVRPPDRTCAIASVGSIPVDLALTFDVEARDHPCRQGNLRTMVDTMVDARVPATLFVQGGWAAGPASDDEIAALGEPGMVVGLHGDTHRRFTELDGEGIARELDDAERALRARGIVPTRPLFRLPYLAGNTDGFVLQTVAGCGWWHVDCHAVAYDWKDDLRDDPRQVARNVIEGVERRRAHEAGSAIVLWHSWPDPAPDALRQVMEHADASGDRIVALDDVPRREWNNGIQLSTGWGAR